MPTFERCPTCSGTGAKPGTAPIVCPRCNGRGIESEGQGLFSISQPCSRCGGAGTIIEEPCPTCRGEGRTRTVKRYRVNIPAGVREGSRIRLAGKGEPGRNGGPPGDLYVVTHVQDSPVFARKGEHVEVEVPLTLPEALRGAEIEVPTLDGRKTLRVPAGTRPGSIQRLRGEGPKRLGKTGQRRHPLPLRARPARQADGRAGGRGRRSREGLQRQPARGAVLEMTIRRRTTRIEVSSDRGVFMISVAAELADMHPQTLRMYEQRGLIEPKRSPKGTRLYSHEDVERLRRIQQMTAELGLNLAGVERVLELEAQLERTRRRVVALERRREELEAEIKALEGKREEVRADIVRYQAGKGSALVRVKDVKPFTIPIERR